MKGWPCGLCNQNSYDVGRGILTFRLNALCWMCGVAVAVDTIDLCLQLYGGNTCGHGMSLVILDLSNAACIEKHQVHSAEFVADHVFL